MVIVQDIMQAITATANPLDRKKTNGFDARPAAHDFPQYAGSAVSDIEVKNCGIEPYQCIVTRSGSASCRRRRCSVESMTCTASGTP